MKTTRELLAAKSNARKISMISCYDAFSAQMVKDSSIDTILVGDSVAMVIHGFDSTVHATVDMMETHISAVSRVIGNEKLIVGDVPFLANRKGLTTAMDCVERLMQAGAHAIKIEGASGHLDVIKHIVESGVPVMGHLGLTPQSIHQFGGFSVQAKEEAAAEKLCQDALDLQAAGCFSIVLECVPDALAKRVTDMLAIPTIGIGAGSGTDGQVLVYHDLLGLMGEFRPKFLKKYLSGTELALNALNTFHQEVVDQAYPTAEYTYH